MNHLGTGGMGEVYLATDTRLDRRVALKILSGELAHDKRRMQRFQREARMASSLNQPNILTIFEFGEADSLNFLSTEFIEGETLRQRIQLQTLKLTEILDISIQVLAALEAAHEARIVHRDIKPENVMIRRRDHIVKVLDFGLAKTSEPASVTQATDSEVATQYKTAAGTILGTVNYMSPEQAQGFPLDERTDLWSTGVMIYEMLAGEAPFKGRTASHTIVQILENEPVSLRQVARFKFPDELDRIVDKALVKNVDERYQTAKDMLIDLRKLRKLLDVESEIRRSVGPAFTQSRSEQTNAIAAASTVEANTSRPVGTGVKFGILFGVIALLVGSLWAINSWRHSQSNPVTPTSAPVPERVLTYSITVQKYRDNKPFEPPFQLAKEMLFERDYQIRLNVNSPQSGFLYILNEGPHEQGQPAEFVVLFPSTSSNSGSALINENQPIQIPEKSWIRFDQEKGTERVWLVFSRNAITELEPIRTYASMKTQGLITDAALRDRVQQFLRTHAEDKSSVTQNAERKETRISAREEMLVHSIDLEHQ
ncbi:MAG TPA: serine/threonine-protein kinase [Pyrinomonadaceae bacterium]|nr:serine/threonine-protein kinase [Pyrinomonadaceae bacterium]